MDKKILEFDGGSRGNPGPAGYGFIVTDDGYNSVGKDYGYIGETTNNVAEYTALVEGLKFVVDKYPNTNLKIIGDSQLVVKQVKGEYSVNSKNIIELHKKVQELINEIDGFVEIEWVSRENNGQADELVNKAIDEHIENGELEGSGDEPHVEFLGDTEFTDGQRDALTTALADIADDLHDNKTGSAREKVLDLYEELTD